MPMPATTGQLRTRIQDMQIGDYIVCNYQASSGAVGTFSNLGGAVETEIPVAGSATPNGSFYFVKVDKGLLIADRVIQHSISWDTLNAGKAIQGKPLNNYFGLLNPDGLPPNTGYGVTFSPDGNYLAVVHAGPPFITVYKNVGAEVTVRSLTGGVAYADGNGNFSLTDQGHGGWPTNNEWDKYIVNFPANKIQAGKTLDDVFHHETTNVVTWCQDTPINGMTHPLSGGSPSPSTSGARVHRGLAKPTNQTNSADLAWAQPYWNTVWNGVLQGFRPVFEYKEA